MASNQQILEKAIQKAIDGGWDDGDPDWKLVELGGYVFVYYPEKPDYLQSPDFILYDHDFAKALWGETPKPEFQGFAEPWQYHLQSMVIAEDPITYLGENI